MKLLIIRNSWGHNDFGGAESMVIELAKEYRKQRVDTVVISGTKSLLDRCAQDDLPYKKAYRNPVTDYSGRRYVLLPLFWTGLFFGVVSYLFILHRCRPDALHVHSRDDYISASIAGRLLRVQKIVWTDHAELKTITTNYKSPIKGLPGKAVVWSRRLASEITTVSAADKKQISHNTANKIAPIVIYNGVPAPQHNNSEDCYTFCFATRVNKQKGIYETLDAFDDIQKRHPKLSLLVNYDRNTPNSIEVSNYIQALNNPHITLTHPYSDGSIGNAYIFLMPSHSEGLSLALLKACARRRSIITTAVGGTTEFLENKKNALLIPPQDKKALIKAMETLIVNKSLRRKLASNAYDTYSNRFRISDTVKKHYLGLLK